MPTSHRSALLSALLSLALIAPAVAQNLPREAQIGPRPFYLVDKMKDGPLKQKLSQCTGPFHKTDFSIGHRGAALQFPEHTQGVLSGRGADGRRRDRMRRDVYKGPATGLPAFAMRSAHHHQYPVDAGACREVHHAVHSGRSRHRAEGLGKMLHQRHHARPNSRRCRPRWTDQIRTPTTAADYQNGTPRWRTDLYSHSGTLMTHDESIALIKSLGAKFTPELKAPEVAMPFDGDYTQEKYAAQMLRAYKDAGIPPSDVFAQSFSLADILYWVKTEPEFGAQAVYLDGRYESSGLHPAKPETWKPSMTELKAQGVKILAPPIYMMLALNDKNEIVPSEYAKAAKAAGLDLIGWSLERDGPLDRGGGFYHKSIKAAIDRDGDTLTVLDVLAQQVGVRGMFSDWPATTTFYASCMGMK